MYNLNGVEYLIRIVTEDDIANSHALDQDDLGCRYIMLNGCYYMI